MKLTTRIIKALGFKFIKTDVTYDISRGSRWENDDLLGLMLAEQASGGWSLWIRDPTQHHHICDNVETVEDLIKGVYKQGRESGVIEAKKFLRTWIGY
jgi:hypothetical protein